MGKKGKKAQAGKPKKLTPKDVGKRLNALAKNLEEELEVADLFAPLPPTEDCAICLVPLLPFVNSETTYLACCGNYICTACSIEHEDSIQKQNKEKSAGKKLALACPLCREPFPTGPTADAVEMSQIEARCQMNDHKALSLIGKIYEEGLHGKTKDDLKAIDCFIRAAELGSADACAHIGYGYNEGNGVSVDKERAAFFRRVGALRGSIGARHKIGCCEYESGNHEIGIRHWKIAAEAGYQDSLNRLKDIYNAGGKRPGKEFISKEEMDTIYRSGHDAQMEVKSEEREKHRNGGLTEVLKALSAELKL
jgi:TPR repeat protein